MDHVRQNEIQGRNMVFFKAHAYSMYFILPDINSKGCQIGMLRPQPRHFCKLGTATFRMTFLDLNLHVLQLATSN